MYKAEIENAPIVKIIDSIIEEGITLKCSDIHFEPYENIIKVKMRIDGKILDKTLNRIFIMAILIATLAFIIVVIQSKRSLKGRIRIVNMMTVMILKKIEKCANFLLSLLYSFQNI